MPEEHPSSQETTHPLTDSTAMRQGTPVSEQITAEKMRELYTQIKPKPLPKKTRLLDLIKKIPFLVGLLRGMNSVGSSLSNLATLDPALVSSLASVSSGFQYSDLVLRIFDFLRIPALYIACTVAGEKSPITLKKNARWAYSAVIITLCSIAIALPALAVPMGLTIAGLTLITTAATMIKILIYRKNLKNELDTIEKDIIKTKMTIKGIIERTQIFENNDEERQKYTAEYTQIPQRFLDEKNKLQTLCDQQFVSQEKLKKNKPEKMMDKGVALALTSIAIVGLILSFFVPTAALIIAATTATFALVYFLSRTVFPAIHRWVNKQNKQDIGPSDQDLVEPKRPLSLLHQHTPPSSTRTIEHELDSRPSETTLTTQEVPAPSSRTTPTTEEVPAPSSDELRSDDGPEYANSDNPRASISPRPDQH
jgi:hypothetical protein